MNFSKQTPQSFFCFGDAGAGTGGASPAPAAAPAAAPAPTPSPTPAPSPAPAPTPGAGATPPAPAPAADPSDPFSGLGTDFDDDLDIIDLGTAPATDAGVVPVPAPVAADPAKPAASEAPAPIPPVDPKAVVPAAAPTPTAPASPRAMLDQTVDGFKTNQVELGKWAAENLFKLSKEDAESLVTNAEDALPQLAGKVYSQILIATGNMIKNLVPGLIEHTVETTGAVKAKSAEAIGEFYSSNSDLNEATHGELVKSWAKQFRLANPKATRKEAIDFVARAVRIQAGLPMPTPGAAPAPKAQPFAPARPGGRQPVPTTENDPYAGLGEEFD